ncbi:MAG TPA: fibronectin type III domain-containing protein [Kofleriaceae bacterium]|nr:fibronectin type III domain-containing protein [Kofleriaceae bacterium]
MRTALALVAAATVAACGDDGGNTTRDAAVDAKSFDAPPDADLDIGGSWVDRYISASGTAAVSNCQVAPTGVVIDPATAATTPYAGACKADGTFRIIAPASLGAYFLRLGTSFYETTKRTGLDLSTDHLGRSDIGPIAGVTLNINMLGMDPWAAGDAVYAFSSNIGFSQPITFTTGAPNNGDTALNSVTASWNGYKIDSGKLDTLMLMQIGVHTTAGGLGYTSLDRAFGVPPFTMANNTATAINGVFSAPTAASLQLRIDSASFNQFATVVNPNVTNKTIDGSLFATVSTDAKAPPPLLAFSVPTTGVASLDFGTLSYGDPFATQWQRLMRVQAVFSVPYTYAGISGSRSATMTRVVTRATAAAGIIDAVLGPPTAPTIDNVDAFSATTSTTVPKLTWSPPALGTPTDYEVQAYEVTINGSTLKFTSVLKLTTKQTSVRIPEGLLLGQRQYIFSIASRIRQGVDIYATPLQAGDTSSSAETLTALVTTN